jgi:hypothetical protein
MVHNPFYRCSSIYGGVNLDKHIMSFQILEGGLSQYSSLKNNKIKCNKEIRVGTNGREKDVGKGCRKVNMVPRLCTHV